MSECGRRWREREKRYNFLSFFLISFFPLSIFLLQAKLSEERRNATTSILETTFHLNIFVSSSTDRAFFTNPGRLKKMRQILSNSKTFLIAASFCFSCSFSPSLPRFIWFIPLNGRMFSPTDRLVNIFFAQERSALKTSVASDRSIK